MRSVNDVPEGSTVFLRTGMDVPLEHGSITDPSRIEETRPTIDVLRAKKCRIIVATHIGRPEGRDASLSAKPVADYLSKYYPVHFVPEIVGATVATAVSQSNSSDLIVIENLRYDPREEKNEAAFAQELVAPAQYVVQDAYANCHREHASMTGVLEFKAGYAGLLLEKELNVMKKLEQPEHPYIAIIGGAKADKIPTINGLLPHVDLVLLGGALANTFLKAAGHAVGASKVDDTKLEDAKKIIASGKVLLPIDVVVAEKFDKDSPSKTLAIGSVQSGMILDIGPASRERYASYLQLASTIVWAGPIGVFEWSAFSEGTKAIAQAVVAATENGAYSVAAGGDSGAALVALGYKDKISHVSTGGGVTLQLLEGKKLPAVEALEANSKKQF